MKPVPCRVCGSPYDPEASIAGDWCDKCHRETASVRKVKAGPVSGANEFERARARYERRVRRKAI